MKGEGQGHHRGQHCHGEECKHKNHPHHRGAKTFRRGRAISFLEMMYVRRATIMKQLGDPEFQSIQPILVGELKALDMVINEFKQQFEIHDKEVMETTNMEADPASSESSDKREE